jgi:hypothetical protein
VVYVVERYLPGQFRTDLLPGISKLETVCGGGSVVRYLGSTIVPGDEACFCQFDGPSEAAVAEANRRAGLPFDRIVPALLVDPNHRRGEMSVSTSIPKTGPRGRSLPFVIVAALAAVIAVAAWAVATYSGAHAVRPTNHGGATQASVLSGLTPQQQQYVRGIVALTPTQLRAAFGTEQPSGDGSWMRSLTPRERRDVQAIASMSLSELAAAFGTGK